MADDSEATILMYCLTGGDVDLHKLLSTIKEPIDTNFSFHVMTLAAQLGHAKCISVFVNNVGGAHLYLSYRDEYGMTVLHVACTMGNYSSMAVLLDKIMLIVIYEPTICMHLLL